MPDTDLHGSSSLSRSIFALRRDLPSAMNPPADHDIDLFHRRVADLLRPLASELGDLLSTSWIGTLLDSFLVIHDEFHSLLATNREAFRRPPMDRLVSEFSDRSVKALDVCNAIRDGIENVRRISRHAEIAVAALGGSRAALGEGQFRRAKRALTDLTIAMLDEKEANSVVAHRNRSFGKPAAPSHRSTGDFRSLSWSVSRSWSAARQLQAIASNLSAPRSSDVIATGGLAAAVFAMNCVVLLVMWTLVAAIPCQDRGLQTHFPPIPRGFMWAVPMMAVHDRIAEEAKKRERKSSCGLLMELHAIERGARGLVELTEGAQFLLGDEREGEVRARVVELSVACEAMKGGLEPLEMRVREVFQRIARSRTDRLDVLGEGC